MLPTSRAGRRRLGGAAVLAASVLSVLSARGFQKPVPEEAPAFRQKGDPGARIVIVEFSDFQCPGCRAAEGALKGLLELYGRDIRFIFKHFPLEGNHPWARPAAAASECAGRQGRFWPFHDALYDKQAEWSEAKDPREDIRRYAKEMGLDPKAFEACLSEPAVQAAINADIEEGNRRWVHSTPTFFVNRKRFVGARQLSSRGMLWIEKTLKKTPPRGAGSV